MIMSIVSNCSQNPPVFFKSIYCLLCSVMLKVIAQLETSILVVFAKLLRVTASI